MKLGTQVSLDSGHIVSDGDPAPPPQRDTAAPLQFSADVYCAQTAGWIKMALGVEVGLGPGDIVHCARWERGPLPKRGQSPQFLARVYCGSTAGWIKMPLGMEIDFSPCDIVLDGDPAPPKGGGTAPSPIFSLCLLWQHGCMYQNTTWYGGRPQPRRLCVR